MTRKVGIPYARNVEVAPGRWGRECPVCLEVIAEVERKDAESFTGREYAAHYESAHGGARQIGPRRWAVDGIVFYPYPDHGAWYEVGHRGEVGSYYMPMFRDGTPDTDNVGIIEIPYDDAEGEPMTVYVIDYYAETVGVGPNDPDTIYGQVLVRARDVDGAMDVWEGVLDADAFTFPVYRIDDADGFVPVDLNTFPDTWNFVELVMVDCQVASDQNPNVATIDQT